MQPCGRGARVSGPASFYPCTSSCPSSHSTAKTPVTLETSLRSRNKSAWAGACSPPGVMPGEEDARTWKEREIRGGKKLFQQLPWAASCWLWRKTCPSKARRRAGGYNLPTSLPVLGPALHFNVLLQRKLRQRHSP